MEQQKESKTSENKSPTSVSARKRLLDYDSLFIYSRLSAESKLLLILMAVPLSQKNMNNSE